MPVIQQITFIDGGYLLTPKGLTREWVKAVAEPELKMKNFSLIGDFLEKNRHWVQFPLIHGSGIFEEKAFEASREVLAKYKKRY